jgi:DNA-binding LacI/PurR family transcriptional regulator
VKHSAWAAEAIGWAKRMRINNPSRLSILSLENNPDFATLNLSYVDMQIERIGYLMAHAIIGDIPIERTTKGFVRVGARVVERVTTGLFA